MKFVSLFWIALMCMAPAPALSDECKGGPTADLSARVSVEVPNDVVTGVLVTHASDTSLELLSRQVKATVNNALVVSKKYPGVNIRTGQTHTYPTFDQNNRKIRSWSMRSEIVLDSKDKEAFSELVGVLQEKLEVVQVQQSVSQEKIKALEDASVAQAIQAFNAKAALIASAMGRKYSIRHLAVTQESMARPPMAVRAMSNRAGAEGVVSSPMPLEMGTSSIAVSVSGQILLE